MEWDDAAKAFGQCKIDNSADSCPKDHGEGTRTWNHASNSWNSCELSDCDDGYHADGGLCVLNEAPCDITNKSKITTGKGIKEWIGSAMGGKWGECEAVKCEPGYTMDKSLTNEPGEQCGQCSNFYGYDGEQAVQPGAYDEECAISSGGCLDLNKKYIWENGECVPICETRTDETGSIGWVNGKCQVSCESAFTMWGTESDGGDIELSSTQKP
jgi:hypothetical protein